MEPKVIKQERESAKEETTNEETVPSQRASSMVQNLTNYDARITRGKGMKSENLPRNPLELTSGMSGNNIGCSSMNRPEAANGEDTEANKPPKIAATGHSYSPVVTSKHSYTSNGSFSPHSTVTGTSTPSPPALTPLPSVTSTPPFHPHSSTHEAPMSATNGNILHSGASNSLRQITKVRRFLTTLQQFASDINTEVGDRVRALILNLLSGSITVEEFHCALQEVTHFPLRPFVLPFLRSHLPLLTRELLSLARRAAMTVPQYIAGQESNLLDATVGEPTDFFSSEVTSGKRKLDCYSENGDCSSGANSNSSSIGNGNNSNVGSISPPPSKRAALFSPSYPNMGLSPELNLISRDCKTSGAMIGHDDEWKNIHVMLTCILSMVEKTRRALTMLQQREDSPTGTRYSSVAHEQRRPEYDAEVRRHASELVAHAIRSTEDRVAEVKRKAEEAVLEVRKAAVVEVQRAVATAESKAQELVTAERSRIEGLLREVALREASGGEHKIEPQQACWNCGRKAQDTCSGCNVAKYCSPYCQHKDWDHHHKVCSSTFISANHNSTSLGLTKNNCKLHKSSPEVTKSE